MIITEQKPFTEVLSLLDTKKPIFIVGCSACATKCKTGGDAEVTAITKQLLEQGFQVFGSMVIDTPCDMRIVRRDIVPKIHANPEMQILVLACGSGVQTVASLVDVPAIPALNTLFIGATKRIGETLEFCQACGACILGASVTYCPITRCPKSMMNGPCGGVTDGKCEVNPQRDCIWTLIYKKKGSLGPYQKPKAFTRNKRLKEQSNA